MFVPNKIARPSQGHGAAGAPRSTEIVVQIRQMNAVPCVGDFPVFALLFRRAQQLPIPTAGEQAWLDSGDGKA